MCLNCAPSGISCSSLGVSSGLLRCWSHAIKQRVVFDLNVSRTFMPACLHCRTNRVVPEEHLQYILQCLPIPCLLVARQDILHQMSTWKLKEDASPPRLYRNHRDPYQAIPLSSIL